MSLNKCTNVTGRITISPSAPRDIQINGPKSLNMLQVTSAKSLRSISSSSVQSIDSIKLSGLPNLASLSFSALNTLESLQLEDLPALENCSFGLGPRTAVKVFNTSLQSVEWLKWPVATSLNISSNENLRAVSLPWEVIDGAVEINENPALEKVDVFSIKDVKGDFTLEGNDALKSLTFEKLESVEGNVLLSGTYGNVSMPVLNKVGGGLTIKSTDNIQEFCDELDKQGLKAKYECTSEVQRADDASAKPAPPKNSDSAPKPSDGVDEEDAGDDLTIGAKIGIITASVILGLFLVVGALSFFRARSRGKVREIVISSPRPISAPSVAASSASSPKLESAEAVAVGKGVKDVGGVRVVLNGEEMREVEVEGRRGRGEVRREEWRRRVSSAGSEVPLIERNPLV
ncbi:cell wall protein Ecm33 [Didymosphaeria variabile]|uniref:Cell wall protein Ecm33 n=1 Tax=Didymosphaeria variabile TaxID=1932322 RepID=A0A9W9C7Q4_9PLEO|nr:cell wall protein Ecm33 [Didymosphaeria variabile]KAJ4349730.1 cell wall protein Ecm33 [Didymosphaeria variabile]